MAEELSNARIDQLPLCAELKPGYWGAVRNMDNHITERFDFAALLTSTTSGNFEWITDHAYSDGEVVTWHGEWYQANGDIAENVVPGTDPAWEVISKSPSGFTFWQAGVYTQDDVFVLYKMSTDPDAPDIQIFWLANPLRPFPSSNFLTELEAGDWIMISGGGDGGGGSGIIERAWKFIANTTASDPGNGSFRMNNSDANLVTELYFSETAAASFDAAALFGVLEVGYRIIAQQRNDASRLLVFEIASAPIDNGAWWTVPVNVVDVRGLLFVASAEVVFLFDLSKPAPAIPDASETVKGLIEIATQAEVNAGIDDLRAITPFKLANRPSTGWSLASGGTLTGVNTITSNAPNQLNFGGTWTATADNQFHEQFNPTISARIAGGDTVISKLYNPTLIATASSQNLIAVDINPTFPVAGASNIGLRMRSGSMLLGATTSLVSGGVFRLEIKGFGNSTLGAALAVYNSDNARMLRTVDNGVILIGGANLGGLAPSISVQDNTAQNVLGNGLHFNTHYTNSATNRVGYYFTTDGAITENATTTTYLTIADVSFNPTAGTNSLQMWRLRPSINQTGTATGYIAGYVYDPAITAIIGKNYSFISSSGDAGFGTMTPTAKIHAKGNGTTTGELFRLDDSANVNRIFVYDGGSYYGTITNGNDYARTAGGINLSQNGSNTSIHFTVNGNVSQLRVADGGGNLKGRLIYNGYVGLESLDNTMPIKVAMPIVNAASGAFVVLNVKDNGTAFNPSSGTASFTSLLINPLYNVTGTYIGRITGIDYNPALTSMIGVTHYGALIRSGLVGMGLGATLPTAALHVKSPGNTSSTYCAKFDNSDGVMLLGVNDGKYIEIGGDTFVISVGSTIPSGAAYMEINSNQVLAYFMTDKVGNVIEEITTTTGAISRKLKTELVVDQLAGDCPMTYIQRQSTVAAASTTTTVAAVNMAVSEQIMDVRVQFIITELGGDGGGCNINATIRRSSAGTVALVGAQDKGAGERRIAASGAPDWTCNLVADDTNKRLNINFTNNSATPVPKAFKVTAHIWYTKTIEPSV